MVTAYELAADRRRLEDMHRATVGPTPLGLSPVPAVAGTPAWWAAVEEGSLEKHVQEGVIARVLWGSMGDWPEFELEGADGTRSRWTRMGDPGRYVEGRRARVTWVEQAWKTPNPTLGERCRVVLRVELEVGTTLAELVLRRGVPTDADTLAELAVRTFHDTFAADNRPEDLAEHLASTYGPERQRRELTDPDLVTLVAEDAGALVAFAQLRPAEAPEVALRRPVEVWRFYVDRPWHGRGLAQRLMDAVLAEASAMGAGAVWLGVWERNPRAIAFYLKFGFDTVGSQVFVLGQDRQTDLVMVRPLA